MTPSHILKPQRSTTESSNEDYDAPPGYDAQNRNELTQKPVVVLCSGGKCMGVDVETGEGKVKYFIDINSSLHFLVLTVL